MWLLVGLGNPGSKYVRTRHNIGFMVIERFAGDLNLEFKERQDARISSGSMEGNKIVLIEPLTFMNRSGSAVKKIMDKFTILPEQVIVVHDDLDLETGRIKVRKKGSSGGHRGIESIIQHVGSREFIRMKIGIGRDPLVPVENYVLSKFRKDELPLIREAIAKSVDAIRSIIVEGADKAMNRFN